MKLVFIINERAGQGRGKRVWQQLQAQLTTPYEAYISMYAGHASIIAQDIAAKQQPYLIIVIGGDGTIHEVANHCVHCEWLVLGCIRAGSGNDFGRAYKPFSGAAEIEQFLQCPAQQLVDTGRVNDRYFTNNCGIGFDAYVCLATNHSSIKKWFNKIGVGKLSYAYYVMIGLFQFKPFTLTVQANGETRTFRRVWFATVSNHPYFGGGMKISPASQPADGQLELTVVHSLPRLWFLLLFGSVFFGGHTRFEQVEQITSTQFEWYVQEKLPCHMDGEVVVMDQHPIKIDVAPNSLVITKNEI